jgi:hypothetical protein
MADAQADHTDPDADRSVLLVESDQLPARRSDGICDLYNILAG